MMQQIPKVGDVFPFFDDGKIKPTRLYKATVTKVIKKGWAPLKMRRAWRRECREYDWLYAADTDYFIYCSIPKYDTKPVVFARTADGGWFSFDFPAFWMGGRLDVDGTAREVYEKYYGEMKL